MPLSEKTIAEMNAGAVELARQQGASELPPGYMEAIIQTQQRYRQLKAWESAGQIRIELATRLRTSDRNELTRATMIHVGMLTFQDVLAEETGSWPSEVLMANVALALMAGQGAKDRGQVS